MALVCSQLRDASDANDHEECIIVLDLVNQQFLVLRENLNHIVQMERAIHENEVIKRRNM
ncbi:unnamed protein product [Prunus armeniaca]